MVVRNTDKIRFKCFKCEKILVASVSLLEKTTKCPGCQSKLTPKDHLMEEKTKAKKVVESESTVEAPVKKEKKKSNLKLLLLLNLLVISLVAVAIYFNDPKVEYDKALLEPVITIDNSDAEVKQLKTSDIDAITASFKDPSLLPTGSQIPEFTPDQSRPTRYYLGQCVKNANKLLAGKTIADLKLKKLQYLDPTEDIEFELFNQAYAKSKDPIYLSAIFDRFLEVKEPSVSQITQVLSSLAMQKSILTETSSKKYISSISKIKNLLDAKIKSAKSPLAAIDLLNVAMLLPKGLNQKAALKKAKPILEDAFKHINPTRTDGLFLSPEESTEFSLKLIKLSWQYHLEKKTMPQWLYQLAEKESCRLAYRLEPDGCLPVWEKGKPRINLSQHIYKASKVFDRDDLRFIAHGGMRIKDAYPPKQKDFYFPEIGVAVIRTNWNIYHLSNPAQNKFLGLKEECFQVTFRCDSELFALYAATADFGSFLLSSSLKSEKVRLIENKLTIGALSVSFELKENRQLIKFSGFSKVKFKTLGVMYLNNKNNIEAFDRFHFISNWERFKHVWACSIDELNSEIIFDFKSLGKYKLFMR